jgi:hypothetical protein
MTVPSYAQRRMYESAHAAPCGSAVASPLMSAVPYSAAATLRRFPRERTLIIEFDSQMEFAPAMRMSY